MGTIEESRQHILQEAEKLFMKYGIRSVTMDDIAKAIGMSKKTIYVNFKDKNELVHILFSQMFSENRACIHECSVKASNAVEEAFELMELLKEQIANINPVVFYDLEKYHTQTNHALREFKHGHVYVQLKHSLERGIKEGVFRQDINVEILAAFRVNQIDWIFECDLVRSGRFSMYDVFLETTFHFLRGITTTKGNELIEEYLNKTN